MPQNFDTQNSDGNSGFRLMLSGAGEMGELIGSLDWSETPLGPIETWSTSLLTTVKLCIYSRFPTLIWWGRELIQIYNDAYRPILGLTKHPSAMGQAGAETWKEAWHILGPMVESVFLEGKATWSDDQFLPVQRFGFVEETYFTFSYSPIFDEANQVGGILITCTETTGRVLSERRLRTLRDLAVRASEGKSPEEACRIAADELAKNQADIPFGLIYLLDEQQPPQQAKLTCVTGIDESADLCVPTIDLAADDDLARLLNQVLAEGQAVQVDNLASRFNNLAGSWDSQPDAALILPVAASGHQGITGFLLAGISPRLLLNEDYRHFYELVVGHIATAVANARAYEEERRRAEALAEIDRAKTEFFSNVSHEFRTPLTLMLNPLKEVLNEPDAFSERQLESLQTVYRNSLRLQKLVNTLLDFSRIQANRIRGSFEPTDLAALTTDLASSFRSVIERAGLYFEVVCPNLPEPVYVDQEMWEKIVLNLLSNAFKFTFEGGIRVALEPVAGGVQLKVQDSGIGIAENDLPYIFDRFHQVRGVRSRTYEGSGIGLALVAELVRFHDGQIEVASTLGEGTTFTVTVAFGTAHLPQDQIQAPRMLVSTAIDAASYTQEALHWLDDPGTTSFSKLDSVELPIISQGQLSDVRILIADDNADMRHYLRRLLEPYYQIETVSDGLAALRQIAQHPPALLITDVMMPNLDGFGLLQQLRASEPTRTLPVMLLSARAGEEARIEGLQAGADDYLTKPFSARELLARVEAQLQLTQLRQHLLETEQTARIAAELENERISNLLNTMSDGFVAVDRNYRYIYLNQRAEEIFLRLTGRPAGEFIGATIWEKFPGLEESVFGQTFRQALLEQVPFSVEDYFAPLKMWVDVRGYPYNEGLSIYFQDITPRKQAEQALEQYALDLKRTNDELERFAYITSHDLQEPLRMVTSYLQLLKQRYSHAFDESGHEFIGFAVDGALRMKMLINDLLIYSHIKADEHNFITFSSGVALQKALMNLQLKIEETGAAIDYTDLPTITGSENQFVQLFQNLVGNAIKFHGENPPVIKITAQRQGTEWLFTVSDNGIGIAPEYLQRIFVMFQRLHTREQYPGTGIGLAICKKVVEYHRGKLWVESTVGEGTTFYFTIPALP